MLGYKHSRSSLVFRICNILFSEFSTDSLNLPMPFPANLVDVMSNSLHMKIILCRWGLFLTMIPLLKFIHQPCSAYRMTNSVLFCSIWLTGSIRFICSRKCSRENHAIRLPANWTKDHRYCHWASPILSYICLKHLNNAKNCMLYTQLELVSVHPKMHKLCLEENWNIIGT